MAGTNVTEKLIRKTGVLARSSISIAGPKSVASAPTRWHSGASIWAVEDGRAREFAAKRFYLGIEGEMADEDDFFDLVGDRLDFISGECPISDILDIY